MRNIIVLFILLLLSLKLFAQEKIAYFNSTKIILDMTEYKQMQDSINKTRTAIETELNTMKEEYKQKYEVFLQESDTLIESIKIKRWEELQDLGQRVTNFHDESQQRISRLSQLLWEPIQKKLHNAIQAVGSENGYTYIIDINNLLYISPTAIDATSSVRKKIRL